MSLVEVSVSHYSFSDKLLEAQIGGYEVVGQTRKGKKQVYDLVARLIGCQWDEVA